MDYENCLKDSENRIKEFEKWYITLLLSDMGRSLSGLGYFLAVIGLCLADISLCLAVIGIGLSGLGWSLSGIEGGRLINGFKNR
jgi:hypothetical protein